MSRRNGSLIGAVVALVITAVILIGYFVYESGEENKASSLCEEQGYKTYTISQYARGDIYLCVDEDGVLRIPLKDRGLK